MLIFTSLTNPHVGNYSVLNEIKMWDYYYLFIFYNEVLDQMMHHEYAHAMFMSFASYLNVFLILSQIYPFKLSPIILMFSYAVCYCPCRCVIPDLQFHVNFLPKSQSLKIYERLHFTQVVLTVNSEFGS